MNLLHFLPQTRENLKSPGVYAIFNTITGTIYIGSSAAGMGHRREDHFGTLRRGTHGNERLQRSWNKYGKDAFRFEIIEVIADPTGVLAREQVFIDYYFGNNCFNARRNADNNFGWVPPEGWREKRRAYMTGRPLSEEAKKKIGDKRRGAVMPQSAKDKLSADRKGQPAHPRTLQINKERMANPEIRKKYADILNSPEIRALWLKARIKRVEGTLVSPEGEKFTGPINMSELCRNNNLSNSSMSQLVNGKRKRHHGWTYIPPENAPDTTGGA